MVKKVLSDVVVTSRKVSVPSRIVVAPAPTFRSRKASLRKILIVSGGVAAIAVVWIFGSFIAAKTEVILTPKRTTAAIEKTLILAKGSSEAEVSDLSFSTISFTETNSDSFRATEKKKGGSRAEGVVAIFNKGKEPQVLISSTRLEAVNGKIYRIPRTVVIPAARAVDKKLVPGSEETKVVADKAGADYNLGFSDFTLPGLKGSPRHELVFGRSKTEIAGGFAAEEILVGKSDKEKAINELTLSSQKEAKDLLLRKLPSGEFLLFPSVEFVLIKETADPPVGSASNSFNAKIEGEARGAVVPRESLEKLILKDHPLLKTFEGPENLRLGIKNLEDLSFKLIGYKFDAASFKLQISGEAQAEAVVDADMIKSAIIERGLSNAGDVLSAFPALARAEMRAHPFWLRLFYKRPPSNPNRIDIILRPS